MILIIISPFLIAFVIVMALAWMQTTDYGVPNVTLRRCASGYARFVEIERIDKLVAYAERDVLHVKLGPVKLIVY